MNLKNNKKGPEKKKTGLNISFSLNQKKPKTSNSNALNSDSESDDDKKTAIDTFDKSNLQPQKETITIKPQHLNSNILKAAKKSQEKTPEEETEAASSQLQYGLNEVDNSSTSNPSEPKKKLNITRNKETTETVEEDQNGYNEVPVEEFGAALLRGMGWKPPAKSNKVNKPKSNTEHRQKGLLLGIGAQSVKDEDLAQELLGSKSKFQIPVLKRNTKTGEIIREDNNNNNSNSNSNDNDNKNKK